VLAGGGPVNSAVSPLIELRNRIVVNADVTIAETSFDQAKACFNEFLSREGVSNDLLWLFREDVVFQGDNILIRTPVPRENDQLAENCYELGRQRNFGVALHGFCLFQSYLCCYLILPEDDLDAQYLLMSSVGVKYSVVSNPRKARSIKRSVAVSDLGVDGFNTHIPSKLTLLPMYPVVGAG